MESTATSMLLLSSRYVTGMRQGLTASNVDAGCVSDSKPVGRPSAGDTLSGRVRHMAYTPADCMDDASSKGIVAVGNVTCTLNAVNASPVSTSNPAGGGTAGCAPGPARVAGPTVACNRTGMTEGETVTDGVAVTETEGEGLTEKEAVPLIEGDGEGVTVKESEGVPLTPVVELIDGVTLDVEVSVGEVLGVVARVAVTLLVGLSVDVQLVVAVTVAVGLLLAELLSDRVFEGETEGLGDTVNDTLAVAVLLPEMDGDAESDADADRDDDTDAVIDPERDAVLVADSDGEIDVLGEREGETVTDAEGEGTIAAVAPQDSRPSAWV